MNKILLVTAEYPPDVGGVANYYYHLVQNASNNEYHVLDNSRNQLLNPWIKSIWAIIKEAKVNKVDYLLAGQILPIGTAVVCASLFLRKPFAVFIHGMDIAVPQKFIRKKILLKFILRRADKIITISDFTEQQIKNLIPGRMHSKISIIPPGPSITPRKLGKVSERVNKQLPKNFFLSVGRLVQRKGFDKAIEAMSLLSESFDHVHYVIAGSGSYKENLIDLATKLQLQHRVHVMEGLTDAEVAELYNRCEFFVMPSRIINKQDFEGFGITVLEANSFGKLAIGGNTAGMTDAILDGKTGILVNPDDSQKIADAIQRLLSKPDRAKRLGAQAQQWVKNEHDWHIKAQRIAKLLSGS
ncbi:MAG: glycosyltransferase family 4 protein [bacterium]|nr:glycosyltransferase family 4 protein [bacterium]